MSSALPENPPTAGIRRRRLWSLGILVAFVIAMLFTLRMSTKAPGRLGVQNGRLVPCPASPNCVCSHDMDKEHAIEAFRFTGNPTEAMEKLKQVIAQAPRTRVIESSPEYLHTEFRTAIFRFVDDVEFLLDTTNSVIHVRSASRVGHSDLGTNRKRVEALRRAFGESRP